MTESPPLTERLRVALRVLLRDRLSLHDSEVHPVTGLDAEAREWLAEYDEAIAAVRSAIRARKAKKPRT